MQEYLTKRELPAYCDQGNENARIMREQGIKPGTPAWFELWFGGRNK
jgi:hypothetical protein